jgi:undecaprenyl pyrophosphate synthase
MSTDNLARKPHEVSRILAAIETKLLELAKAPQNTSPARSRQSHRPPRFLAGRDPRRVRAAEAATKAYDGLQLHRAAYGGRQEITDAVQSCLREQLKKGKSLRMSSIR